MPEKKKSSKSAVRKKKAERKGASVPEAPKLEERIDQFSEEVENIGKKLEKKLEDKECSMDNWCKKTFGIFGPFLRSVFGIILLSIAVWILGVLAPNMGIGFLRSLHLFLSANTGLFFVLMLIFSYASYASEINMRVYKPFSPIITALGITIAFWLLGEALDIANASIFNSNLSELSFYISHNLFWIFWFVLLIGYLMLVFNAGKGAPLKKRRAVYAPLKSATKSNSSKSGSKRLYRSGENRILGGVCGGVAEYMNIDPVIIRFIWILISFAWGFGILSYIIMWIIMPRNPEHNWEDYSS